jgi:hypothetical protein
MSLAALGAFSSPGAAQPVDAAAEAAPAPADAPVTAASDPLAPADDPAAVAAEAPAEGVSQVVNWVLASQDNGELPFVVIDKVGAELFVFDRIGQTLGHAPVLVGITAGDESSPGVGDRELSHIPVSQRTTPAGRFIARFGPASGHKKVLWVDYADAISLHPVVTYNPKEHRLQRLKSPTPKDNRITFGCINVPTAFYHKVVEPLFRHAGGVVYVLPEQRSLQEVFAGLTLRQLQPSMSANISQH